MKATGRTSLRRLARPFVVPAAIAAVALAAAFPEPGTRFDRMAYRTRVEDIVDEAPIPARLKGAFSTLCRNADLRTGVCDSLSYAGLARRLSVKRRTAISYIADLEAYGVIETSLQWFAPGEHDRAGWNKPNRYRVRIPESWLPVEEPRAEHVEQLVEEAAEHVEQSVDEDVEQLVDDDVEQLVDDEAAEIEAARAEFERLTAQSAPKTPPARPAAPLPAPTRPSAPLPAVPPARPVAPLPATPARPAAPATPAPASAASDEIRERAIRELILARREDLEPLVQSSGMCRRLSRLKKADGGRYSLAHVLIALEDCADKANDRPGPELMDFAVSCVKGLKDGRTRSPLVKRIALEAERAIEALPPARAG